MYKFGVEGNQYKVYHYTKLKNNTPLCGEYIYHSGRTYDEEKLAGRRACKKCAHSFDLELKRWAKLLEERGESLFPDKTKDVIVALENAVDEYEMQDSVWGYVILETLKQFRD